MNIGIVVPYFTPYVRGNEYGLAQSLADLGHGHDCCIYGRSFTLWHSRTVR